MSFRCLVVPLAVCGGLLAAGPTVSHAASEKLGRVHYTRDPAMVTPQLQRGLGFAQSAIDLLTSAESSEELQEATLQIIDCYVLVRAAHHGVEEKIDRAKGRTGKGIVPPGLIKKNEVLVAARLAILRAQFAAEHAQVGQTARIEVGIENLTVAIANVRRALAIGN